MPKTALSITELQVKYSSFIDKNNFRMERLNQESFLFYYGCFRNVPETRVQGYPID